MAGPDVPESALADLPDDVRDEIRAALGSEKPDRATLEAIGVAIAHKRDEAKTFRTTAGIEATWKDAEEAYIGIDDANRHEFAGKWMKPFSMDGPVTTGRMPRVPDHRSTAFVRLTARYVDAGAAKVSEILLPPDEKAFSFSEMPVPELIKAKDDTSQVVHDGMGMAPLTRPAFPHEMPTQAVAPTSANVPPSQIGGLAALAQPPGAQPPSAGGGGAPAAAPTATNLPAQPGAPHVPLTVRDLALENIELAHKKAKAAETRVYDWMVESKYRAEVRKVINDAARLGVGVLKAPFPKIYRYVVTKKGGDGIEVEIKEEIKPASEWVDPWNVFPDPAAGENIRDGNYVFERDFLSERQVRDLKKEPGYIKDQIDAVLEEGPNKVNLNQGVGEPGEKHKAKGRFEVWYFYGSLDKDEIEALDLAAGREPPDKPYQKQVYVIVTLINERAVRAVVNPLDSGKLPYHSISWQRRGGHWAGIGVAEQLITPQRMVNAATRAMLNNAGKSSGSQIVIDRTGISPADGQWVVTPDKIWFRTEQAAGNTVNDAFGAFEIPNTTPQLMQIIQYGMQLAEESTSIPLVTQGQSGETTPETLGATQLQDTNANQLLRYIGYTFDDSITEPVVHDYYEWLLMDPDVPDEEKGDFRIDAHGSVALVERAIENQTIAQMGQMAANPIYGVDPKKWARVFLKSRHLDPDDLQYTPEEQAKIDAQPPPEAPAVTVAKINADVQMKELAAKQSADQQTQASEERIATAAHVLEGGHVQNEAQRIEAERHRTLTESTVKLHELQTRRELAMLDYANKHQIKLDQVKADLAKTAMTLNTQRQLNAEDNAADVRKNNRPERPRRGMQPPGQTPGRAGNGRSFEQGPRPQ